MLWCFLSALRKQDCPGYQLNNSTTFLSWLHALLDPSSLAIRHIDDTQSKGQEVPKQSASAVPALYKARLNKWALETAGNANKARTFRSRWLAGSCIPHVYLHVLLIQSHITKNDGHYQKECSRKTPGLTARPQHQVCSGNNCPHLTVYYTKTVQHRNEQRNEGAFQVFLKALGTDAAIGDNHWCTQV